MVAKWMKKLRAVGLRLADAVAYGVLVHEANLSDAEVTARLEEIERTFLGEADVSKEESIEVARAISGFKFKILCRRGLPDGEVRRLYDEKVSLGFSDLMDEGTIGIYFARYCLRVGSHQSAREVLMRLLEKANASSAGPPAVRSRLRRDASRALGMIRS